MEQRFSKVVDEWLFNPPVGKDSDDAGQDQTGEVVGPDQAFPSEIDDPFHDNFIKRQSENMREVNGVGSITQQFHNGYMSMTQHTLKCEGAHDQYKCRDAKLYRSPKR